MSAEYIIPGDVCQSAEGVLGIVTGSTRKVEYEGRGPYRQYLGIRIADGAQWQSVDPTFVCHASDLEVPVKATVREPCPRDSNGDGDCGKVFCPDCGVHASSRITPTLLAVQAQWREDPSLRLGQLLCNVARNLGYDPYALPDDALRTALEAEHPPRNLPA